MFSFGGVRKAVVFSACLALLVASSACGGTGSGQGAAGEAAQEQPAPDQESGGSSDRGAASTEDTGNNDPNQGDGSAGSAGSTATEPRDGVWTVGDAGEVEFASENGALSFVEARPASGWTERVEEQGPEEIEVDFFRDNVEWQFTADVDGNSMEVETDQTINAAEAGAYQVGDAGEVEFASENGSLSLVEARPASGWTERVEEQGPEEIEVDFFRDNLRYQFTAEIDDGQLEVQVDQQTVGMNPN